MTDTKPTIYLASDHAGFAMKQGLFHWLTELGYQTVDCGADTEDPDDDYPDFVGPAALFVSKGPNERRGIIIGGSGQGEAMAANRYKGVRATVYYGDAGVQADADGAEMDIITLSRVHNNANVLSLGARFISLEEAKAVVQRWLETDFAGEERHVRRIQKLDKLN